MKKIWILVILCSILLLSGCGNKNEVAQQTQSATQSQELKTTVMIYMVGSDLEAKTGAGTSDLEEMAGSGVDISRTNVLVYAGGSPHWHNDLATSEKHTVLQLTESGFEKLTEVENSSMGDSQCLSNFLKYGYSNYPAQQYALVLWDHGNGPVIGYGKDMLFENDSLTLREMQTALADSPFGQEQKLKWVGFDACLMASAELACVWAPYADYLVASQEVEPAFGWNYDFLSGVCQADTEQVLKELAQGYMDACLAYYEERGYKDRDTTLSCVDLRYVPELETAINQLFSRAAEDVANEYNQLTARRAKTRALGRASTGSEYDLIDLQDMGVWLGQMYPDEVIALQQVQEKMMVANMTNAENLCGMSLFYPFYNKNYYEREWAQAYKELGMLADYQTYLEGYEKIWLNSDKLEIASSVLPQMTSKETYTLQLTAEQAESYASGCYYIMQKLGDELYSPLFVSSNITQQDGVLTANFDGNIIYVKNDYGLYNIPVSQEHDTVGNTTRYSVYTYLDNSPSALATVPENFEEKEGSFRYQLAVDNTTKQIAVSAMLPADQEVASQGLLGGKVEDVDLSQWVTATFPHQRHRYLSRYDNGTIRPISDWPVSGVLTAFEFHVADGLEFVYAPLVTGEYYILFEVSDTQGNRYCSELLPINVNGELPVAEEPEPVKKQWNEEKVVLYEQEGITLFMQQVESFSGNTYTLGVDNQTDRAVVVHMDNPFINGSVDATQMGNLMTFEALPGAVTVDEYGISDWGDLGKLQVIDEISSLQFQVRIEDALTMKTLLQTQWFDVQISEPYRLKKLTTWLDTTWEALYPARGMFAQEQVLFEDDTMRLTLLGIGFYQENEQDPSLNIGLKIENLSDHMIYPSMKGIVLDGIFREAVAGSGSVYPGCTAFLAATADSEDLNRANLTDIREAKLVMRFDETDTILGLGGHAQIRQYPIQLSQSGTGSAIPSGGKVIFDEGGIRIRMISYEADDWSNDWYVLVENNTDQDICLDTTKNIVNGLELSETDFSKPAVYMGAVPAHQKTVARLSLIHFGAVELEEMSFNLLIQDFNQQKVIFEGNTQIKLVVSD